MYNLNLQCLHFHSRFTDQISNIVFVEFDLGYLQGTKVKVDNVVLPPWAETPEDFVFKHRRALVRIHYLIDDLYIDLGQILSVFSDFTGNRSQFRKRKFVLNNFVIFFPFLELSVLFRTTLERSFIVFKIL